MLLFVTHQQDWQVSQVDDFLCIVSHVNSVLCIWARKRPIGLGFNSQFPSPTISCDLCQHNTDGMGTWWNKNCIKVAQAASIHVFVQYMLCIPGDEVGPQVCF